MCNAQTCSPDLQPRPGSWEGAPMAPFGEPKQRRVSVFDDEGRGLGMWHEETVSDSSLQGGKEPRKGPLPEQEGSQGEAPQGSRARAREGRWCSPGACRAFVLGFHFASRGLQAGPPRRRDDIRNPACCVFHCLLQEKENSGRMVEASPPCFCSLDPSWWSPVLAASQANGRPQSPTQSCMSPTFCFPSRPFPDPGFCLLSFTSLVLPCSCLLPTPSHTPPSPHREAGVSWDTHINGLYYHHLLGLLAGFLCLLNALWGPLDIVHGHHTLHGTAVGGGRGQQTVV